MMRVENRLGKLAEVRFRPPLTSDELTAFTLGIRELVRLAKTPLVFVTDWRAVERFSDEMFDTFVWIMRRDNSSIRANALLVDAGKRVAVGQVERMISQASNATRRVFTKVADLEAFVRPQLDATEKKRLEDFLAEP